MSMVVCLNLMLSLGPLGTGVQLLFSESGKVCGRKKKIAKIPRTVLLCYSCERKSKLYRIVHSVFHTYLESPFSLKPGTKASSDTLVVLLRTMFHIPGIFMDGQSLF